MSDQALLKQLFIYSGTISDLDVNHVESQILEYLHQLLKCHASLYWHNENGKKLYKTHLTMNCPDFPQMDLTAYLLNEHFLWTERSDPYHLSFNGYDVIGIPFHQNQWGIFVASAPFEPEQIECLMIFAKSVRHWFSPPPVFEESPLSLNQRSKRKYQALLAMHSIFEWEWYVGSHVFEMEDGFVAFFDFAKIQPNYSLQDMNHYLGEPNQKRFKECLDKVVSTHFQVLEEFKCPMHDHYTYQHIQMLFVPVIEDNQVIRVIGYCRDLGRSVQSPHTTFHWFDSDFLFNLPLLPIEWIVHSNNQCEITISPTHHQEFKDDIDAFIDDIGKKINQLFATQPFHERLSVSIQLPFAQYHYQLVASVSDTNPLLWRGFIILLEEQFQSEATPSLQLQQYEELRASNTQILFQELIHNMPENNSVPLIKQLMPLYRVSTNALLFPDLWQQLESILSQSISRIQFKKHLETSFRIPYAQWLTVLLPLLIDYFNVGEYSVLASMAKTHVVESQNPKLGSAHYVFECSLRIDGTGPPIKPLDLLLLKMTLLNTSIDVSITQLKSFWVMRIFMEACSPEQSLLFNSHELYAPTIPVQKKTVLIVDDDTYNCQTIEILFQSEGFRTLTAANGEKALHYITTLTSIDLIILDIRMPIVDGFGVLDSIKNMPNKNNIPLIILTANSSSDLFERLAPYRVDAIVDKPFNVDELIEQANIFIERFRNNVSPPTISAPTRLVL